MTRRTASWAMGLLFLGGCTRKQKPTAEGTPADSDAPAKASELQFDYSIVVDQPGGPKMVSDTHHFRAGDRFRLQVRPQFAAWVYIVNRGAGDKEYSFLFPHTRIHHSNPVAANQTVSLPEEQWYTMDTRPGLEKLVLLTAMRPVPYFADTSRSISRDEFENKLAALERDHRPASSRRFEDREWVKQFASYKDDTVVVVRLALDHT